MYNTTDWLNWVVEINKDQIFLDSKINDFKWVQFLKSWDDRKLSIRRAESH